MGEISRTQTSPELKRQNGQWISKPVRRLRTNESSHLSLAKAESCSITQPIVATKPGSGSLLPFSGTVAILPPIAVPHMIASQSDALRDGKCRLSEWLVNTP